MHGNVNIKFTDVPCNVGQQFNLNSVEFGAAKNGAEIES
jgi:hypothetical protein